jgi:hypothetical protein
MPEVAIDISGLNFLELNELRARIEARIDEMRSTGLPALRERFAEQAPEFGLTVEEIMQAGRQTKRGRARKHSSEAAA